MVVYLATNKINGKMYVGQTVKKLNLRWNEHTSNKSNSLLHKALRKYGKENFSLEILHVCVAKEEMDFAEIFYISFLNTKPPFGYNLTDGGEGRAGYHLSEESKKKISDKNTGHIMSPEQKAQVSKRHKGTKKGPRSDATKEKIRKGHLGKPVPWLVGRVVSEETRQKMKLGRKRIGRSGYRGITWDGQVGKWKIRIKIDGKPKYLGHYKNLEDAITRLNKEKQDSGNA